MEVDAMDRTTRGLLAGLAVLWIGAAAPTALAEEATAVPPAAAEATDEPAAASAVPEGQTIDEGAVELNEAPASVVPGYGGEPPMCPDRGRSELPSV
jgi:hypothetical protein